MAYTDPMAHASARLYAGCSDTSRAHVLCRPCAISCANFKAYVASVACAEPNASADSNASGDPNASHHLETHAGIHGLSQSQFCGLDGAGATERPDKMLGGAPTLPINERGPSTPMRPVPNPSHGVCRPHRPYGPCHRMACVGPQTSCSLMACFPLADRSDPKACQLGPLPTSILWPATCPAGLPWQRTADS